MLAKMVTFHYVYLYVIFDEIHFSSFESGQRHALTSEP